MIRLEGLSQRHPGADRFAVAGLDREVAEGELGVLLGTSGSGKTTTLPRTSCTGRSAGG